MASHFSFYYYFLVSRALISKFLFFTQLTSTGCLQSKKIAIGNFFKNKQTKKLNIQHPVKPMGFSGGCLLGGERESWLKWISCPWTQSFCIYSDFSPKMVNIFLTLHCQPLSYSSLPAGILKKSLQTRETEKWTSYIFIQK